MNFSLLFPKVIDNQYRGHKVGFWLFCLLTIPLTVRSFIHVFKDDGGAQSIATIPLDSWPLEASNTIIAMFAFWGLVQIMMAFLNIVAIVKYKAFIPLMYLVMVITQLSRLGIGHYKPVTTDGTAPAAAISIYLLAAYTIGLVLSLIESKKQHN